MTDHREDLIRAARDVLAHHPWLATYLSINEAAGTVSDRRDAKVYAYIAPAWTALSSEELMGWHSWPAPLPTGRL